MKILGAADVDRAVTDAVRVLGAQASRDWRVSAGPLEWSCWETAAHIAHDLLAYACQVAGQPAARYLPFDLVVRESVAPGEVLEVVRACGRLLSTALTSADPADRAWHWGPTDPSGFAAMGVAEVLLHTYDITQGLGVEWLPSADLCGRVLARLFPDAPEGEPVAVLLWSTGRAALSERPRQESWTWRAALG